MRPTRMTFGRDKIFTVLARRAVLALAWAVWMTPVAALAEVDPAPGVIPFEAAQVASFDGRVFTVTWRAPGVRHVRVYAGTDPRHVGSDRLVGEGGVEGELRLAELPAEPRWYFELAPDRGAPLVVADRSLHLSTVGNLRDVGGYRTADGRWVRMGVAYRSNGLEHVTPAERVALNRLHLVQVTDLRTQAERQRGEDRAPVGAREVSADVLADDADKLAAIMAQLKATGGAPDPETMKGVYRDFVDIGSAQRAYHTLFESLADPGDAPSLFHCTAGKDRTGWGTAVLLTILGVSHEAVVRDYLLTDVYLRGAAAQSVQGSMQGEAAPGAAVSLKLTADAADLEAAFEEVTRRYGSFDAYLHQGLGLDNATLAAIRANLLVGAPWSGAPAAGSAGG